MERRTPKKVVVTKAAVKKAGARATKASAKLEGPCGSRWAQAVSSRDGLHREAAAAQALMPLTLGYGETPLPHEELTALGAERSTGLVSRVRATLMPCRVNG